MLNQIQFTNINKQILSPGQTGLARTVEVEVEQWASFGGTVT